MERKKLMELYEAGWTILDLIKLLDELDCQDEKNQNNIQDLDIPLEIKIKETLRNLGIPTHIIGYDYMLYAIEQCVQEPEKLKHLTKELYPDVAGKFSVTLTSAERALRYAVGASWKSDQLFKQLFRKTKKRPTNGEFLTTVVAYIKEGK